MESVGGPEEEGVGAAGPGAETFIAVDIRDGCGGGVGNRRMVIDPGSGKRTGGCGRRKNGRGWDRLAPTPHFPAQPLPPTKHATISFPLVLP